VASFNVLNYFTTLDDSGPICGPSGTFGCRGADNAAEFIRQQDKLVEAISAIDADIVGLVELENNPSASLESLVDALNAAMGAGTYDFIDTGFIGFDVIKVGLIYKPATVMSEGDFALLDSSVDARFDSTLNRPALAQSFRATSNLALLTVAVNHLKSKGCGGATGGNQDQGDGQGCYNPARASAAEALGDWMNADPTGTGSTNFLILGDLNSYAMEDPISALGARSFTDLGTLYEGNDAYSFLFFGALGALDYAMSNPALTSQVTGVDTWHINADEIRNFDYNTEDLTGGVPKPANFYNDDAYRASDHDPVIVGLDMNPPSMITVPTTDPNVDAEVQISGGGDSCGFSAIEFVNPVDLDQLGANLEFPYGVLRFTAERCNVGSTVTVSVTLPPMPDFVAWFKYLASSGWQVWPSSLNSTTLSFDITDGGLGDINGLVDGTIMDPSGPAIATSARATFQVTKDFSDGNPAEVSVTMSCDTGLPLEQTKLISEGDNDGVLFVITDFDQGELDCTITEEVPTGYTQSYVAALTPTSVIDGGYGGGDQNCTFTNVIDGRFSCVITNTLQQVRVEVTKVWIDDHPEFNNPTFAKAEWDCFNTFEDDPHGDGGFFGCDGDSCGHLWFHGVSSSDYFEVYPDWDGSTYCTVSEQLRDSGVESDDSSCSRLSLTPGHGNACTITNTRFYEGIPTLSQYGLALLALLMLGVGLVGFRRFA
jgi:hypothetical protein